MTGQAQGQDEDDDPHLLSELGRQVRPDERVLLCGWFSFEGGEATAGDLLAAERLADQLESLGYTVDRATNVAFAEGITLADVSPAAYDVVVFVCGPLHGDQVRGLVERFPHAHLVAVNVSVVDAQLASRFGTVIARDGVGKGRPDLSFAAPQRTVPVIGVVRAHPQPEYPTSRHDSVDAAIGRLLAASRAAVVDFDTRVHPGSNPLASHGRAPEEIVALAARMDAVVTSRLHGLALALRAGVPALAIDPVPGGAKVLEQSRSLDWPAVTTVDRLEDEHLTRWLTWCLSEGARHRARSASVRGREGADEVAAMVEDAVDHSSDAPEH